MAPDTPHLELIVTCPAESSAAQLLRNNTQAVLDLVTAEERALLAQLSSGLQAGSILLAGLLLTGTQHDTCIAKLGLMQAVAVFAAASRYVSSIRSLAGLRNQPGSGLAAPGSPGNEGPDDHGPGSPDADQRADPGGGQGGAQGGYQGGNGCSTTAADLRRGCAQEAAVVAQLYDMQQGLRDTLSVTTHHLRQAPEGSTSRRHTAGVTECKLTRCAVPGPPAAPAADAAEVEAEAEAAEAHDPTSARNHGTTAALRSLKAPPGVWTSLQLEQLPLPLAHQLRLHALHAALLRLAAAEVHRDGNGDPGTAEGVKYSLRLEHSTHCGMCSRLDRAVAAVVAVLKSAAGLAAAALLVVVAKLLLLASAPSRGGEAVVGGVEPGGGVVSQAAVVSRRLEVPGHSGLRERSVVTPVIVRRSTPP